jgi:predicted ATPase
VAAGFGGSLIGRERELELLGDLLGVVRDGSAVVVLLEGEAGIGKTRLLASLSDLARERGMAVFRGAAHPLERPFGPLVDALDLVPSSGEARRAGIGRLLMGDELVRAGVPLAGQLQFRAVEEIIDLIEVLSDEHPLLLALDDLHWADSSTLIAVRWVLRRLTEVPLLMVATLRPSPRASDLAQLVEEAVRSGARLVRLAPLGEGDVMALVQTELGLAPGLALAEAVRGAGGNPLWVVELLRSLSAEKLLDLTGGEAVLSGTELPDSIRQLVLGRVGELPEKTVSALRIASLLGDEFSLRDLATVTGGG